MLKPISLALLAVGMFLVMLGINTYDPAAADFSKLIPGAVPDLSVWKLTGGIFMAVFGMAGLLHGSMVNRELFKQRHGKS